MFKTKKFYRIESIEKNVEYYGHDLFTAGYKYSYTPTSYAMKYIAGVADKYINASVSSKRIDYAVVKSENEQRLVIKVTGRAKVIESFISEIISSDEKFSKNFSMEQIPSYYV